MKGKLRGSKAGERWMGKRADGRTRDAVESPKVPVVVAEVGLSDMKAFLDASSTLMAEESVEVVSRATGIVVEILVEEGDSARKGQTLVRLAYEELELEERRARADLDKLRADFERAETLSRESLISEEDYQSVRFDRERAEIDWQKASLELERTRITAPISGTVTERWVNLGQLVQANAPVFRVVDFDSLVAPIYIPEKYLLNLRDGQKALVLPRGLGNRVVEGTIVRISPIIDSQSGTVKVTVGLGERARLRPGMFANVQVVLDTHEGVVVVLKKALVFEDEEPHAFVVHEGKAEKRRLDLGYQDTERVEVVQGLEPGETVVLVGQSALKDGSLVEVQRQEGSPEPHAESVDTEWGATSVAAETTR